MLMLLLVRFHITYNNYQKHYIVRINLSFFRIRWLATFSGLHSQFRFHFGRDRAGTLGRVHMYQDATASLGCSRASRAAGTRWSFIVYTFERACVTRAHMHKRLLTLGKREKKTKERWRGGRMLVTLTVATFSGPPSEEEPERSSSSQGQRHGITPLRCI